MRLVRYNSITEHVPGKLLIVKDTFPRSPQNEMFSCTVKDKKLYINSISKTRPLSDRRIREIRNATCADKVLQEVSHLTLNRWNEKKKQV